MNAAELTLRFGATRLHASVHWPRADCGRLALVLTDELPWAQPLVCDSVVLALNGRHRPADELAALEWLAEHGGDLCAAPNRLIVAGGARAARLAVDARDSAWTELHRQVLVHPRFGPANPIPPTVAGVAPAIVVCGGDPDDDGTRYAALLREAGVEVDEVLQ
jgi:acetyl esterase/lipase